MAGLYRGLKDWRVDEANIRFEFFGPREDIVTAPLATATEGQGRESVLAN